MESATQYRKGQVVRFSAKVPERWRQEYRRGGKVYPATDRCIVSGFPRAYPGWIIVIQEFRTTAIRIPLDCITPLLEGSEEKSQPPVANATIDGKQSDGAGSQSGLVRVHGRRGRPKGIIDSRKVEELLAQGLKMSEVVKLLSTTRATIYRHSQSEPALKAAIMSGRKKGGTYSSRGGLRIAGRHETSS